MGSLITEPRGLEPRAQRVVVDSWTKSSERKSYLRRRGMWTQQLLNNLDNKAKKINKIIINYIHS